MFSLALVLFHSTEWSHSCSPQGKELWLLGSDSGSERLAAEGLKWDAEQRFHREVILAQFLLSVAYVLAGGDTAGLRLKRQCGHHPSWMEKETDIDHTTAA